MRTKNQLIYILIKVKNVRVFASEQIEIEPGFNHRVFYFIVQSPPIIGEYKLTYTFSNIFIVINNFHRTELIYFMSLLIN